MKIIIFGASGSGTTTLAQSLAKRLDWTHLDADDFYWQKTDPPFQKKVPKEERIAHLKAAFLSHQHVVISGSLLSWGTFWNSAFDLGVFLWLPPEIRMERLRKREWARYGDRLQKDAAFKEQSEAFLWWAAQYDDPDFEGRSIGRHRDWIEQLECAVLEVSGDLTNEVRLQLVMEKLKGKIQTGV